MTAVSRRGFLAGVTALIAASRWEGTGAALPPPVVLPTNPFTLGVASGDPTSDGFVLWTRLAPKPTAGGGMPVVDVPVEWEVATDPAFADIVAAGVTVAVPALAHSVHVEVTGLDADAWFHYRFRTGTAPGTWTSPVGRARTTPAADAPPASTPLRIGVATCQSYTDGYYTAHRHLSEEGCDLVVFLGDYIYEGGARGPVRSHASPEATTLAAYRNRYGLYKKDPDLQAAHAACPWLVVWDDHEVDNNYAGAISQDNVPVADFLARRAQAYQAWYEHQPVRLAAPSGPDLEIHRRVEWGRLARLHLLDGRQHRDDQPCGGGLTAPCDGWDDPARTMLGAEQETWLLDALAPAAWPPAGTSRVLATPSPLPAVWEVLANQVVFAPMPIDVYRNMDQWDGYPAARDRVWNALREVANPVVLTGDIHLAAVAELHRDLEDPKSRELGVELVTTSISSRFTAIDPPLMDQILLAIPWFTYANAGERGYLVVDLSDSALQARFRTVSTTTEPTATVRTAMVYDREAVPVVAPPDPEPTTTTTSTTTTSTTTTSTTSTSTTSTTGVAPSAVRADPTFAG